MKVTWTIRKTMFAVLSAAFFGYLAVAIFFVIDIQQENKAERVQQANIVVKHMTSVVSNAGEGFKHRVSEELEKQTRRPASGEDPQSTLVSDLRSFMAMTFLADTEGNVTTQLPPGSVAKNVANQDYFRQAMVSGDGQAQGPIEVFGSGKQVVIFAKRLLDEKGNIKGIIGGGLPVATLIEPSRSLKLHPEDEVLVVGAGGTIISSTYDEPSIIGKNVGDIGLVLPSLDQSIEGWVTQGLNGKSHYAMTASVGDSGWTVVLLIPDGFIVSSTWSDLRSNLLWLVVSVFMALGLMMFMTRRYLSPIALVATSARMVAKGLPLPPLDTRRQDEVGQLMRDFTLMVEERQRHTFDLEESSRELTRKRDQLAVINRLSAVLNSTLDVDQVLELFFREVQGVTKADRVSIALVDEDRESVLVVGVATKGEQFLKKGLKLPLQDTRIACVIENGKPIICSDLVTEELHFKGDDELLKEGIRSGLLLPLVHQGEIIGTLNIGSSQIQAYSESDLEILVPMAAHATTAIVNSRMFGALSQAYSDLESAQNNSKLLNNQLLQAQKMEAVGEMAAGVAHEINNPLTTILLGAELMSESDLTEDTLADLTTISNAAQRAAKIVQGLLLFARREDPQPRPMGIDSVVDQALELKQHDFRNNNINTIMDFESEVPNCLVDNQQMSQVFVNILNNAQHALTIYKSGGEITIKIESTPDAVTVEFRDDGPGIEPETLEKIFQPFYTTKEPGEGTGLGLSICHGIVQQHGGEMWATSKKGTGMSFFVRLPTTDAVGDSQPRQHQTEESIIASKGRLLVVDDEPDIRQMVAKGLNKDFVVVDQAPDGQMALDMIRATDYDSILLDLKMPGIDGREVFEKAIKHDPRIADRIIFMTGDTANPETESFLSNIRNTVIHKPFTLNDLRGRINGVLTIR